MFDHLLGRPPTPGYRRAQVLAIIFFWLWRAFADAKGPRLFYLRRINRALSRFTPWQLVVTTLTAVFAVQQWDAILGLSAPEPLARLYSHSYYRSAWIATGLDAGFATSMNIRPKWLRDFSSIIFSIYYILSSSKAEEKLRKFRAVCTVEMLRATWNKTTNPYIRAITYWDRPSVPIARKIYINKLSSSLNARPIAAWLFFSRSERELKFSSELILDFPGGGFVTMAPQHHEERLRRWAIQTGRPVLSVDYSKAPEYPYPYAINECFDLYNALVSSNGQVIGMSGKDLKTIFSGDSAGGNIAVNVLIKILEAPASSRQILPTALVLNYPALDFRFTSWMTPAQLSILRAEHQKSSSHISGLAEQKDHFAHKSPLSVVSDAKKDRNYSHPVKHRKSWIDAPPTGHGGGARKRSLLFKSTNAHTGAIEDGNVADSETDSTVTGPPRVEKVDESEKPLRARIKSPEPRAITKKKPFETRLTMTSRVGYFQDKIISPSMMRAMAILYIGPNQNPDFETDFRLSPVLAPNELLARFPLTLLMCGEKDPFVDDAVIMAGRIREAKRSRRAELRQFRRTNMQNLRMTSIASDQLSTTDARLMEENEDDWVQLEIIEGWSHGYLQMTSLMKEARYAIEHQAEWIEDVFVSSRNRTLHGFGKIDTTAVDSDLIASGSSETEPEELIMFTPKARRQSSIAKQHIDPTVLSMLHPGTEDGHVPKGRHCSPSRSARPGVSRRISPGFGDLGANGTAYKGALVDSPDGLEPSTSTRSANATPGMVSVKETDLMKRRRLDAVIGMEETGTPESFDRM